GARCRGTVRTSRHGRRARPGADAHARLRSDGPRSGVLHDRRAADPGGRGRADHPPRGRARPDLGLDRDVRTAEHRDARRRARRDGGGRAPGRQRTVVFDRFAIESMAAVLNTDLLTPLGAYLRLRGMGRASFLLESVERGRLGRYSWMGAGSRLVTFDEAAELGVPVVGYIAYDHVARLEPVVPLPAEGRDFPESRLIVAET